MWRSKIRVTLAAAVLAFPAVAVRGGVNQWTSHGPPAVVGALAVDPVDPRIVYAARLPGTGAGIFRSSDGGESWEELAPGGPFFAHVNCLAVDPTQPATVYATKYGGEFLTSHDGGSQWDSKAIGPAATPISIAIDSPTGAIYLGMGGLIPEPESSPAPVLKSMDGGVTWGNTALKNPLTTYALLADSLNETLLVGTDFGYANSYYGGGYYYGYGLDGYGGNVGRTLDGGASWSSSPTDLGSPVKALAKDSPGSIYYAGTLLGAVYRSFDRGATWSLLTTFPGSVNALAVDPSDSSVLYVAIPGRGVLRSTDGGANWRSFNTGLATRNVTALTLDATGHVLHVATGEGVFDMEIAPPPEPGPCAPGLDRLCFFGSRFRVELTAIDPFTKTAFAALAVPGNSRSGYFSFPSLTGDATFPEVMVKMVDATSLPGGGYWVFYGGMTSLLYTLRITDTTTGLAREYAGEDSCGGADATGFLPGAAVLDASPLTAAAAGGLSGPDLLLLSGRFRISLTARDPFTPTDVPGLAIPQADRFGSFSLPALTGDPALPEVFVKMIDATGGAFLFFHTALTSLPYRLSLVDTVTGTERTYVSDPFDPNRLCGGADLLLFPQ